MIKSFRHRGIESFFRTGSKAGIQPKHAVRLRLQLGQLDAAIRPDDMDRPGWRCHRLKGDLDGHYAVWVDENWRLTFRIEASTLSWSITRITIEAHSCRKCITRRIRAKCCRTPSCGR